MALRRRSGRDWFCRRSRAHSGSCWRGFCCPGRSAPLSSSGNVEIGTDSQRDLERFPHGRSRWERGPRWEAASGVYSCYGVGGGRVPEGITLGSEIANHNSRVFTFLLLLPRIASEPCLCIHIQFYLDPVFSRAST